MAGSVTWTQLRELAAFRSKKGCGISLYMNLDPSEVPTPGDVQTRVNALHQMIESGHLPVRRPGRYDIRSHLVRGERMWWESAEQ